MPLSIKIPKYKYMEIQIEIQIQINIYCNDPLLLPGSSLALHTLIFNTNKNTNPKANKNTNKNKTKNTNKHVLQ